MSEFHCSQHRAMTTPPLTPRAAQFFQPRFVAEIRHQNPTEAHARLGYLRQVTTAHMPQAFLLRIQPFDCSIATIGASSDFATQPISSGNDGFSLAGLRSYFGSRHLFYHSYHLQFFSYSTGNSFRIANCTDGPHWPEKRESALALARETTRSLQAFAPDKWK